MILWIDVSNLTWDSETVNLAVDLLHLASILGTTRVSQIRYVSEGLKVFEVTVERDLESALIITRKHQLTVHTMGILDFEAIEEGG